MDAENGTEAWLLLRPDDIVHNDASPQKIEVISKAFRGAEYTARRWKPGAMPGTEPGMIMPLARK